MIGFILVLLLSIFLFFILPWVVGRVFICMGGVFSDWFYGMLLIISIMGIMLLFVLFTAKLLNLFNVI